MRSDREILRVANKNIKDLTNDEFDRYQELMRMPVKDRYAKASGGKVHRGRAASKATETA